MFNSILKNALARGTPGYCKWHPRVPRHPGWEPLVYIMTLYYRLHYDVGNNSRLIDDDTLMLKLYEWTNRMYGKNALRKWGK